MLLETGFSPYKDNSALEKEFFGKEKIEDPKRGIIDLEETTNLDNGMTVSEALTFGLELKEKMMNNQFRIWQNHSKNNQFNRNSQWVQTKRVS